MWPSLLAWIICSLLAYALATNLGWMLAADPSAHRRLGPLVGAWQRHAQNPDAPARWALEGVYFLGVPAVATALRVPRPSLLGLVWPASVQSILLAGLLAALVLGVLVGAEVWLARTLGRPAGLHFGGISPAYMGRLAVAGLFLEAHWAFLRAGTLSSGLESASLAVFLALGLVALEAWSNPWQRGALAHAADAVAPMRAAGLAVLSALVFLVTASSAVCLAAHLVVAPALAAMSVGAPRAPASAPAGELASVEPTVI